MTGKQLPKRSAIAAIVGVLLVAFPVFGFKWRPSVAVFAQTGQNTADEFDRALAAALQAWELSQQANTAAEWDRAARQWMQAVAGMQAVPPNSPKREFAQKKVVEYLRNAAFSLSLAATAGEAAFPTFNSPLLDAQLELYRSYIAAVGKPDVLVVGSSRVLQGVDAKALQRALGDRGYGDIKVFNFGVNGATAQVVNLIVRQILKPEELPDLIVWADGVRAFNSGRSDRTYQAIINSPGYRAIVSQASAEGTQKGQKTSETVGVNGVNPFWKQQPQVLQLQDDDLDPHDVHLTNSLLADAREQLGNVPQLETTAIRLWVSAIDSNGFLPVDDRFDPVSYYQTFPRVGGRYDGDYQPFNLGGEQAAALQSLMAFARSRNIPVAIVSLPLSSDYLDPVRLAYERQFSTVMGQRATQQGFTFVDLSGAFSGRNDYFADPSHLNAEGAAAVARLLAAETRIPWPR